MTRGQNRDIIFIFCFAKAMVKIIAVKKPAFYLIFTHLLYVPLPEGGGLFNLRNFKRSMK